ncbi:substrate-binding periplasmic protein [Alteromonas halophila]|uniref:Solute-binding protein family 3/N-terminal domain-containing protein n=1 Tax=Alteromonas halophila TaxID=516698 RepID=A0A918JK31_9ALTE|nr:transporter substrate-binding domain-containing protein [Alteromonas halophila]GGW84682.1 hypothetical protein GCM10007391_18040 [Alteromonas halophila]
MIRRVLSCLLLITLTLPLNARVQVIWGTDVWEGYTEPDGTGFYQELIALIFPSQEFDVEIEYLAWKRVSWNLRHQHIDMTGALHETDDYYLSATPVLSERILALTRNNTPLDMRSSALLKNLVGAYRSGYEDDIFHEIVPEKVTGVPVDSPELAISLLTNNKIDYYVELESMLASKEDTVSSAGLSERHVGTFHLYWAFTKTPKGKYIKTHFDRALETLRQNGKLASLYKKYDLMMPAAMSAR